MHNHEQLRHSKSGGGPAPTGYFATLGMSILRHLT